MTSLEKWRAKLPEPARDIKLNLEAVLGKGALTGPQRWMVALATAHNQRHSELVRVLTEAAAEELKGEVLAVLDDAAAAAALMAMNNIYYRFCHVVGNPSYAAKPPRLRMNRLAKPATNKIDFELACLAVSAVNGCEACVKSHEAAVRQHSLSEEQVHDAVRIASVIVAAVVSDALLSEIEAAATTRVA